MLDLRELERRLDNALAKETTESLTSWLLNQRKNNPTDLEHLLGNGHTRHLEKKPYTFTQSVSFSNSYNANYGNEPTPILTNAA